MARELTKVQLIERSISHKYRKWLWAPFLTAINQYEMIKPGDVIAVCISGGKDSMLLAKLMQMLEKYSDIPFTTKYIVMDPGYRPDIRKKVEENLKLLDIPATIFETNIFEVANNEAKKPCYLCARMRRGSLYSRAQQLGCNKIALGHHLSDAIETTVMAMFYSSKLETIVPKCYSENFKGMELIRPMYCIKEEYILKWCRYNELSFINCACRFTERSEQEGSKESKRKEIKELIQSLKKVNPEIEDNIFHALHRVQLESFPGYKQDGKMHSFLENYKPKYGYKDKNEVE